MTWFYIALAAGVLLGVGGQMLLKSGASGETTAISSPLDGSLKRIRCACKK